MSKDWRFSKDNSICNFRTVGVLIRGDKILVQREKDSLEYALPGGHVKINETSEQSLIREYKEETGAEIICDRIIWIEETFWNWNGKDTHTIAFYYLIKLVDDTDIPDSFFESQKDNCNVILEWISVGDLKKYTVYPSFLAEKVCNISSSIEHFISLE